MKKKVCINIGHSAIDSGAIGADGTKEHDFNKNELYPFVKKELELKGFEVITIIQEKSFGELPKRINALKPDVIISLHSNAYNGKATGSETLYFRFSKRSKSLATTIQKNVVNALGLADRGPKPLTVGRGSALLILTNAPCVILEPFFIDNCEDLAITRKKIKELSKAIADGVSEWVG